MYLSHVRSSLSCVLYDRLRHSVNHKKAYFANRIIYLLHNDSRSPRACHRQYSSAVVRPPGTLVPKALCFSRDVFFFLTRHRISELRRPIASKLCTVISICVNFLMQVQKLGGPPLKKILPPLNFRSILHNFRL